MGKPFIELIICESGDWEVLRLNYGEDFNRENHSISNYDWIKLLDLIGLKVEVREISDRDMEEGNY